jgi:hypothetical protein
MFTRHLDLKKGLWCGGLWSDVYFVAMIGERRNREVILRYVAKEGIKNPEKQLQLFNFKH